MGIFDTIEHNTKKLFKVRCSPDCPFDDCVILTNVPPQQQGEGQGGQNGNSQPSDGSSSDNSSSNNNNSTGEGQTSSQGEGASPGNQQANNKGGGNNRDQQEGSASSDSDSSKEDTGESPSPQGDSSDSRQEQGKSDLKPDKKPQDGNAPGEKQQPKDRTNEDKVRKDAEDKARDEERERQRKQEAEKQQRKLDDQRKEQQGKQGNKPGDSKGEVPPTPDEAQPAQPVKPAQELYFPVYGDNVALPKDIRQGGSSAGISNVGIADLGKHNHREPILTDQIFQTRLKNVMKDNAFDRPVRGRKRGKLDMRSLYKVPMKAENVFTLKEARKNKHYNVILMVDQSGSMYDGKIEVAADVAAFLARSMDKIGVQYAVVGYSDGYRYHKKFTDTATDATLSKMKYDLIHTGGGGTQLLDPIKDAYKQLRQTPDWTNIVISISDGQPSAPGLVKQFIKGNAHVADYIDVSINSRPLMDNGFSISGTTQLKPILIRELRRRIKRG